MITSLRSTKRALVRTPVGEVSQGTTLRLQQPDFDVENHSVHLDFLTFQLTIATSPQTLEIPFLKDIDP
jgi:hypothetical protein